MAPKSSKFGILRIILLTGNPLNIDAQLQTFPTELHQSCFVSRAA